MFFLRKISLGIVSFLACFLTISSAFSEEGLSDLIVQKPLHIEIFAKIPGARSIAVASEIKTVFVGTRDRAVYAWHEGKVFRLSNALETPNGVAWQNPWLYIAEQDKISRYRFDTVLSVLPKPEKVFEGLPNKRHHGWRYIMVEGDTLYVAVGAPCNICRPQGIEGTIIQMDIATVPVVNVDIIATGVRNSVGIDTHPDLKFLYFTDNGADHMGEDIPKEELNVVLKPGGFYGYPWYGGGKSRTKQFLDNELPARPIFPITEFPAHTAPLGVHFYRGGSLQTLKGKAIIALHGSWNRRVPDGYRVMVLDMAKDGRVRSQKILVDGFLKMRGGRGRPVDIKTLWDGRVLISDDTRGAIYVLDES